MSNNNNSESNEFDVDDEQEITTFYRCPNEIHKDSEFAIIGVPFDGRTTQRRGLTFNAPEIIRKLSDDISVACEDNSYFLDHVKICDLGNINENTAADNDSLNNVDPEQLVNIVKDFVSVIYEKNPNIKPVFIGGNHFISYPTFSAILEHYKGEEIIYITFDAHLDFYDDWEGNRYTHCTVSRRNFELLKKLNSKNLFIIGTRDVDLPELEDTKEVGFDNFSSLHKFYLEKEKKKDLTFAEYTVEFLLKKIFTNSEEKSRKPKAYISLDIDVLCPSVAPGTGYCLPDGLTYRELHQCLEKLVKIFNIIAFDFVEFAPNLDLPNQITGFLSAKIISEFMMLIHQNNEIINKNSAKKTNKASKK